MRLRLRSAARLAVVPLLAIGLALGACARPGTLATVDGDRISDRELAQVVAEFDRLGLPADPRSTLQVLIVTGPLLGAASELGVGVSTAEGIQVLDAAAATNGVEPFEYSQPLIDIARTLYLNSVADPASQAVINEALASAEITVNPRFGSFDVVSGITATQWPWLVTTGADGEAELLPQAG